MLNRHRLVPALTGLVLAAGGLVLGVAAPASASVCTDTWTNAASGAWGTAGNWDTAIVPGTSGHTTDVVCIPSGITVTTGAAYTVEAIIGTTATPGSLNVNGGTVTLTGASTASALATLQVQNSGTLTVNSGTAATPGLTVAGLVTLGNSNAVLSGTGAIQQTAGTTQIPGQAEFLVASYTTNGDTSINGGTFASGNLDTFTGTDLDVTATPANNAIGSLSGGGTISLSGTLTDHVGRTLGPHAFAFTGGGNIHLLAGTTTMQSANLTGSPPVVIDSGATIALSNNGSATYGNISGAGTVKLAGAATVGTITSAINLASGATIATGAVTPTAFVGSSAVGGSLEMAAMGNTLAGFNLSGTTIAVDLGTPGSPGLTISGDVALNEGIFKGAGAISQTGNLTVTANYAYISGPAFTTTGDVSTCVNCSLTLTNDGHGHNGTYSGVNATLGNNSTFAAGGASDTATLSGTLTRVAGASASTYNWPGTVANITVPAATTINAGGSTGTLTTTGTVSVPSGATLTGTRTMASGTATIDGTASNGPWTINGGILKGTGAIVGAVTNVGGTVAPGDSPGTLTVNTYVQQAGGTLAEEIAGSPGSGSFDQLHVTTTAALGGTLAISGGYLPTLGDAFPFITATTSVTGTFATVTGTVTSPTTHYAVGYAAKSATITNVLNAAAVPGAPTLVATPDNGKAFLTITAPASDGGAPIDHYTATVTGGGATTHPAVTAGANVLTGLANGTTYTISVIAHNSAGDGAAGTTTVTPVAPVGPAPTAPTITSVSAANAALVVAFTAPTNGAPFTGYTATAVPVNTASGPTVTTNGTSSPITVGGLTNGAAYTITVHATNATGKGPESAPVEGVAGLDKGVSLLLSKNPVAVGEALRFYGYVADHSAPLANQTVTLQQRFKKVVILGTVKTNAQGQYSYTLKLSHTGAVRAFSVIDGQTTYAKELLGKVSFAVKGLKAVTKGTTVVVTGTLTPGSPFAKESPTKVAIYKSDAKGAKKGFLAYAKLANTKAGASKTTFSLSIPKGQLHGATYLLVNPLGTAANFSTHVTVRIR